MPERAGLYWMAQNNARLLKLLWSHHAHPFPDLQPLLQLSPLHCHYSTLANCFHLPLELSTSLPLAPLPGLVLLLALLLPWEQHHPPNTAICPHANITSSLANVSPDPAHT